LCVFIESLFVDIYIMKSDILKDFGLRVKQLRLERNWTQQDLADQSGFHKNYIGMVERGERNISLRNIEMLAKAFGMTVSNLLIVK
jgi:transcriptional regulator with XRE-family HTH domain